MLSELPRYFFPVLVVTFFVAKHLGSPHYYSAFEFEKSPCFQKLIACSDTKPATQCLNDHASSILAQVQPVLTNVGFQAAHVCLDQVRKQSFHDSEMLLNVQRCFYLAEMLALSPTLAVAPKNGPFSTFFTLLTETPLMVYLAIVLSAFFLTPRAPLGGFADHLLSLPNSLEEMYCSWEDKFSRAIQSFSDTWSFSMKTPTPRATEGDSGSLVQTASMHRSFPCSAHGLSQLIESSDELPNVSDTPSSGGSITVYSDGETFVANVKPSFDISTEAGRAAMKAYVEAKMRNNNYEPSRPTVRYKEVPRRDSRRRKLRRVFIPRRGWVSLRKIEMEEQEDGRHAFVRPC